jgi:hypothetical protein
VVFPRAALALMTILTQMILRLNYRPLMAQATGAEPISPMDDLTVRVALPLAIASYYLNLPNPHHPAKFYLLALH